jgi:C_GCAxxG_C_C family probable redox protein
MDRRSYVAPRVYRYYWEQDLNCAGTTLKILAERFGIDLSKQVLDASVGMHGAGGYRAQCGLVEGGLMFLGILGAEHGFAEDEIVARCREYARRFEAQFGSLSCRDLRPGGFRADDPPHLCEDLSRRTIAFDIRYVLSWLTAQPKVGTLDGQ